MKQKINFIFLLFLLAPIGVSAFQYAPEWKVKEPNKIVRFFSKIRECKLRISCYRSLGAFTEITSATAINSFPTIYNNNLAITLETGTTSVASITTLAGLTSASSLATVGTITSGTWNASTLTVAFGGTGSTTLSAYQVLLGNGTGNISVVAGLGSSGQFLTSGGAGTPPTWTTGSFDTALNYTVTGSWVFNGSASFATSTAVGFKVVMGQAASEGAPILVVATTTTGTTVTQSTDSAAEPFASRWAGAQSSRETDARLISSVTIRLNTVGTPTDSVRVAIVGDSGNNSPATNTVMQTFDGASSASSTRLAADITGVSTDYSFGFYPAVYVPGGARVWIVFYRTGANSATNDYQVRRAADDLAYANGKGMQWLTNQGWTDVTTDWVFSMTDLAVTSGQGYIATGAFPESATSTIGILNTTTATSTSATILTTGVMTTFRSTNPLTYLYLQNKPYATSSATGTVARVLCWAITTTACKLIDKN